VIVFLSTSANMYAVGVVWQSVQDLLFSSPP
jgi:hypothetical protein